MSGKLPLLSCLETNPVKIRGRPRRSTPRSLPPPFLFRLVINIFYLGLRNESEESKGQDPIPSVSHNTNMPKPKVSRAEKLRARLFTSSPPMRPTSPPRTVFPFRDHPRGHATRRDSNPKRVESSKGAHGSAPGSSRDAAWPRHAPGFEPEARERRDARGAHSVSYTHLRAHET